MAFFAHFTVFFYKLPPTFRYPKFYETKQKYLQFFIKFRLTESQSFRMNFRTEVPSGFLHIHFGTSPSDEVDTRIRVLAECLEFHSRYGA